MAPSLGWVGVNVDCYRVFNSYKKKTFKTSIAQFNGQMQTKCMWDAMRMVTS